MNVSIVTASFIHSGWKMRRVDLIRKKRPAQSIGDCAGRFFYETLLVIVIIVLTEQKRYTPKSRDCHKNKYNACRSTGGQQTRSRAAEDGGNQIKPEKADKAPVQRADNDERQRNDRKHGHFFIQLPPCRFDASLFFCVKDSLPVSRKGYTWQVTPMQILEKIIGKIFCNAVGTYNAFNFKRVVGEMFHKVLRAENYAAEGFKIAAVPL